jgi:hypothetical protein
MEGYQATIYSEAKCKVIGENTGGGSAFYEEHFIDIKGEQYSIKIPTRRLILNGEREPIEATHIKPNIAYEGEDIIEYAVKLIKR